MVVREPFNNPLDAGKRSLAGKESNASVRGGEVMLLLDVKVHHCHESSESMGDIQLMTSEGKSGPSEEFKSCLLAFAQQRKP